jgi:hypothetical protein
MSARTHVLRPLRRKSFCRAFFLADKPAILGMACVQFKARRLSKKPVRETAVR